MDRLRTHLLFQSVLGLQFDLPPEAFPHLPVPILRTGPSNTVLRRNSFRLAAQEPTIDFFGIGFEVLMAGDAAILQAWVIFTDPGQLDWRTIGKKEELGSWPIREGESLILNELSRYGIEPITVRAVDGRPVAITPD